jgi:predicted dehydrogenase
MGNKTIQWGIIGCGKVTEKKSGPAYQKTEGFSLKAVMRRNADLVKDYAKRHGVEKYYSNAYELINDDEIEAIYIATPPDSHKEYALQVAKAGKICCIEKPMAPSYADCIAIEETFRKAKLPLFVAYYRRSLPRFNRVKQLIEERVIGNIRHIRWHLSKPPNQLDLSGNYNWRTDDRIAAGGYFDDLASHGLDLITYLLGNISEAKGISLNQQMLYPAKDSLTACWVHENGITGTGSWNFGCNEREDKVEIYGSNGKLEFSVFDEAAIVISSEPGRKEEFIENPENIQLYHVQNMREHLNGNMIHPSTGESGSHTAWVMDKILGKL